MAELEQPLWRMVRHTVIYLEDKRLPAEIDLAREDFRRMAAILDRHMQGRTCIVGDAVTAADCVTAYLMDWANEENLLEEFPQPRAYLDCMYSRPAAPQRIALAFAEISAAPA